ncbi:MAG: twin-arginine translocase subunit TatC [Acidobacteria bacterium]|nr:MAG: twin-arginine translocase subunit TatC [Acidobacteriota bacterium]
MATEPRDAAPEAAEDSAGAQMSFLEHLEELRRRVVRSALAVLVGLLVCYAFSEQILEFLLDPIQGRMGTLSVIRPAEAFLNRVKAAFVGALFVSLPVILYQAWAFVSPGLYPREKRWFLPVVVVGSALFLAGAGFCYEVAMPAAVNFLAEQGEMFDQHITVDYAFSFSTKMLLGLGVVFEMPLVVYALARLDMVTASFLRRRLDIAVFICFLVAAIITPTPDVVTMSIFALPMIGLYLVSILVAWLANPTRRRRADRDDG